MKNKNETRKTHKLARTSRDRNERRRLVFEKRNVKREMNLARHGAEGGSALVMAKTGEFNRRFVAAFMALVFAISLMTAGIGITTKADPASTVLMSKTNSLFDEVTCKIQFGDFLIDDFTVSLPAGSVDSNIAEVQNAVDAKANVAAIYQKAIVKKTDGSQTRVSSVGSYNGETFYSIDGNNEDTGIRLKTEDGEQLILVYDVTYPVTYLIDGIEGKEGATGTITGQDTIKYGYPLDITATPYKNLQTSPATIYDIQSGTYIISGNSQELSFDTNNNASIAGDSIKAPVTVNINFTQPTKFKVYGTDVEQGHVCAQDSASESSSAGGGNIYGDYDLDSIADGYDYYRNFYVRPGETTYIVLYSQAPYRGGIFDTRYRFLNMIKINGIEVQVPTTYSAGAESQETDLGNGSVVKVKCLGLASSGTTDSHAGSNSRSKYLITITNTQEDIHLTTYFRLGGEQKMFLKGLRGIENTAASHQTTFYRKWVATTTYDNDGFNYFYTLDENSSKMHVYDAYYSNSLRDEFSTVQGLFQTFAYLLDANPIRSSTFPSKNVYLYKVKEGYNPVTVELGTPLYNYGELNGAGNGEISITRLNPTHLQTDGANDEWPSVFCQAIGVNTWGTTGTYYQWNRKMGDSGNARKAGGYYAFQINLFGTPAKWNGSETDFETDDKILSLSGYGKYVDIFGDENNFPRFYSATRNQKWKYGFMLNEHIGENQSITVNALPYQYAVEYDLDGGTISHGNDANFFSDNTGIIYEKDSSQSDSHARHNIETSATITLPLGEPTKADTTSGNVTTSYSFLNWTVVDNNGNEHGTYMPGQRFVIDKTTAGYDTSSSQGDWTYGYAQEDKAIDDDYLKFHFVAKWKETRSTDLRQYQVLGFKETPTATANATWDESAKAFKSLMDGSVITPTTDPDGNVTNSIILTKTYQETEGSLATKSITKTYALYYYNGSNKATVDDNVISFNDHDPSTNQRQYVGNDELSNIEIEQLAEGDIISYYYDLNTYEITVKESTLGNTPDTSQKFNIHLSLKDENEQTIGTSVNQTVYYVDSSGEEGTVVFVGGVLNGFSGDSAMIVSQDGSTYLQLKDREYVTFLNMYENYKLSIVEDAIDGYETTYKEGDNQATSTYSSQNISSDKTVVVQNEKTYRDAFFEILLDQESPYTDETYEFSIDITLSGTGVTAKKDALNAENSNIQFEVKNGTLVGTLKIANGNGQSARSETIKIPDGATMQVSHSDYFYTTLSISEDPEGQTIYPTEGKIINAPVSVYITDTLNEDVGAGIVEDNIPTRIILCCLGAFVAISASITAVLMYRKKDEFVER